jgi:SAM-dependent methyltransferase
VDVTLIQDDMRHFTRPASFDLVLSMFSSFGYFESDEDNRRVVQNACASLKPGGRLVMELMGKEVLARDFQQTGVRLHEPDVLFERRQVIEDWSRIRTDFYVVSGGTTREFSLQLWLYSGRELRQLLADAGFASIKLYGSFEATPYDTTAIRLIAVATKGK